MSSYLYVALLLGALCSVEATYKGSGWWLQQPYTEDDQFTTLAEYGKDYMLNCTGIFNVTFWVIPDMNIIDATNPEQTYTTIDGISATQWMDDYDGKLLNISMVVEDQFGFYYCHGVDESGDRQVLKRALNYQGPYFGDLWEMYRMNTIVGCSAAAGFLVIACVSYFVYEWRCSDDDDDDDKASNDVELDPYIGQTNNGYNGNEQIKTVSGGASAGVEASTML